MAFLKVLPNCVLVLVVVTLARLILLLSLIDEVC